MRFEAKRDLSFRILIWFLGILFIGLGLALPIPIYYEAGLFLGLLFFFLLVGMGFFIFWLWFSTYYLITTDHLIIRYGPFKNQIPIKSISKIEKSKMPLASAALAKERYIVTYNQYDIAMIAPLDLHGLIQELERRGNHSIQVIL